MGIQNSFKETKHIMFRTQLMATEKLIDLEVILQMFRKKFLDSTYLY
jgi:hypothetical protein